jgi:hypothetical protein
MATSQYFNGRLRKLPGAYSRITSGEKNAPANLDFGKILVIDTGLGAGQGGGAGIDGALSIGKDSVYQFTDVESYKEFLKGGLLWKMAEKLFAPYSGVNGVSTVYHVKAATTVAATMTLTATGGGVDGGSFKLKCKDEGLVANGTLTTTHLDKGYAYTIETGINDVAKWIFKIWLGQWKGTHTDGLSYDQVTKAASVPILVASSPEFNNISDLIAWGTSDQKLGNLFTLDAMSAVTGTGVVTGADVTAAATYVVATGGTETYSTANLDLVFEAITDLDYQFILCDKYGISDYDDSYNIKILTHIKDTGTTYIKTMVVGGGQDEDEFAGASGSLGQGLFFNSNRAIVVHGASKETTELLASGFRVWPSVYTAAAVLGRICGLQPQIPVTNKIIAVDGLVHNVKAKDQEKALEAGVLLVVQDPFRGGFKILQGINTIQDNKVLFNSLGQSHSIQFERIVSQINRELIVNSQSDLLNIENGVNVNTLSPGVLKTWTETYLQSRTASGAEADNLLLSFRNVGVTRVDDYYNVSYGIVVNNEITKIFFTGFLFKQ